jgi:hypothetical protein
MVWVNLNQLDLKRGSGVIQARGGGGGIHWGKHTRQPCCRFWIQSLMACSRVNSLRRFSSGAGSPGINSPRVTSSTWLQRL